MKHKILFVCLGNICRSPSAEGVMKAVVEKAGLSGEFEIDSAGTLNYHAGEPADRRMQQHAIKRGYHLTSISRGIDARRDFEYFDHIIGMDDNNMENLMSLAPDQPALKKLSRMTDYCTVFHEKSVPDPYYGGSEGFELVLDLLEDACQGLLQTIITGE